jgi:hypothetical protein
MFPAQEAGVMQRYLSAIALAAAILILAIAAPANAQTLTPCTSSQASAVNCFVGNAVATKILTVPSSMNMTSYDNYAVAVLRIAQDTNVSVILLGTTSAIADAMPAKDANGTANETAQTNAVNSIINSEVLNGILVLSAQTTEAQLETFAQQTVINMTGFTGVSFSPGAALRLIDSYIVAGTSTSGTINWTTVNASLKAAVKNLVGSGMLKLPSSVSEARFTTFVEDVAQSIATYKSATGKKTL